jgi:SM-20-related protein
MTFRFALNPALDAKALGNAFRADGHVSIANFLAEDGAEQLRSALAARMDWRWAINAGDIVYDLDFAAITAEQKAELDSRVNEAAREGFQFRFSSIRVPDPVGDRVPDADIIHAFAEFMRSREALRLLAEVTGKQNIIFADAQATAYNPGDFLTGHDDDIEGKNRELAYVIGLTPDWRVEWGGLLLFHDGGSRVRGLVPQFNCLNLFSVPVLHSVSQVTPFAGAVRYAVTGWLRTEIP